MADQPPLCFGSNYPEYYFSIPPHERDRRIQLEKSLCVIDRHYFHRGRLTIPILDHADDLIFDVWTSISEQNFEARNRLWNNSDRIKQEPYFGWLQTQIVGYGETVNIKTIARECPVGQIPDIEIIEEEHPLYIDQHEGITYSKALQIAETIMQGLNS